MAVLSRWEWGSGLPGFYGVLRGITAVVCLLLSLSVLLPTTGLAAPGDINTVAGVGQFYGEGVLATEAKLFFPRQVALDHDGNIYIADPGTDRIRKVNVADGIITTVAGNGVRGYGGDGGPAVSASLNYPTGVAVDGAGNIYIADTMNYRIRKVNVANGTISTVAGNGVMGYGGDGGLATSAGISDSWGIVLDGVGNIYIADTGNSRIRKVSAANGYISTVAGNGTAGFAGDGGSSLSASLKNPFGVAVDGAGNIFVADTGNYRIRKVNAANGIISTLAGNGTSSFAGDGGAATSASLVYPCGVTVDGVGNIYIGDCNGYSEAAGTIYNSRVRKVHGGVISTVVGQVVFGYGGDGGAATSANLNHPSNVTVDGSGNLYITDCGNHRIRKVNTASGGITTVAGGWLGDGGSATNATLVYPKGIAVDGTGNIYIADSQDSLIRKVNGTIGTISTVAGNGLFTYGGDGGVATAASFRYPTGVAVDSAGNIYVASPEESRIRKIYHTDGTIATVAGNGLSGYSGDGGPATWGSLNSPYGVAVDGAGNIYIADTGNCRVRKVNNGADGTMTTVAGRGVCGSDSGDGGPATSATIAPWGIALDGAGNIYIAGGTVRKVDIITGIISTVAGGGANAGDAAEGGPATSAALEAMAVAIDSEGNLYISDGYYEARIWRVNHADGTITRVAGTGADGFSGDGGPARLAMLQGPIDGIAVDGAGNLYISDYGNYRIRKVSAASGSVPKSPAKIGTYRQGVWYLDVSNNGNWEPGSDFQGYFGTAAMTPVVGDWNGDGHTEIGAYQNGTWYFDLNGNGLWDGASSDRMITTFGYSGAIPVAGDWNGDGVAEIGVYDPNSFVWYLDYNGNFQYDPGVDITAVFGFAGCLPVVGDWNGNGRDKIGVYANAQWYLDVNGNFAWDGIPTDTWVTNYGFPGMLPVAGDWTGNGVSRIGGFYNGDWYLDIDGNGAWNPPIDKYLGLFGSPGMLPVVGRWR